MRITRQHLAWMAGGGLAVQTCFALLDLNGNQQSDVWEMTFGAPTLTGAADADGDRVSNAGESVAGTDPLKASSVPQVLAGPDGAIWQSVTGKFYSLQTRPSLATGTWTTAATFPGTGAVLSNRFGSVADDAFRRLRIEDLDGDGDQLSDWEEIQLGFDPRAQHTERYALTDYQRAAAGLATTNHTVTVGLRDGEISERWPDPGVIAVRRTGGLRPLVVNYAIGGTASRGADYTAPTNNSIVIPAGAREVWVAFAPVADADDAEGTETITLTALPGPGYALGAGVTATVHLANETAGGLPNAKAAARFLVQAAFGPDADSDADADIIPENAEQVMAAGFEAWIDDQFTRPVGLVQPFAEWAQDTNHVQELYTDVKKAAWWNRAMGVPALVPGGPAVAPDPLRQRVAFALDQILVVSDRLEALGLDPAGMANYYDLLLTHSFGNYRDLLFDVSMHPCMGVYLSHLMNRKADPANNVFPDENFAREIMQLFSIGLWELNQDGTRRLGPGGQPIPAYNLGHVTQLARVFTGLSFGGPGAQSFWTWDWDTTHPMRLWDEYHDCGPKTLLNGFSLPARTPGDPDTGAAALLDVHAAIDHLFHHSNTAPFVSHKLIQRFVTSNPGTGYVARVAAKFNDNGAGVRGDLKAVVKAILLDPEARDPARMSDPSFGKQREPFLRAVNFARAFNASAPAGFYALDNFSMLFYQDVMSAPSVFNFYLPGYLPPGPAGDAGLAGPEFQIVNASSAVLVPNYFDNAMRWDLHPWGSGHPDRAVRLDLTQEMALVTNNVDELIRRLDLKLTCGNLSPGEFQVIKEAVERIQSYYWDWDRERVYLAIHAIVTSPEFCVMR